MIVSSIGALYEARQLRRWHRIKAYDEAEVKFKDLNIVIKGKIDDLSLSGIKFISNFKFEKIKLNQLCYLKIKAPDGKIFEFEALVKRFNIENDKLEVGFLFSERNSFDQIVEYVYSYSDRWEKFLQEREKSETIFTNFFFLFSRGLKGFLVACEYVFKKGNRYY
ncbi:PilZ domain-containing protein [Thermodesulfovibrio hydrogeniphilus]